MCVCVCVRVGNRCVCVCWGGGGQSVCDITRDASPSNHDLILVFLMMEFGHLTHKVHVHSDLQDTSFNLYKDHTFRVTMHRNKTGCGYCTHILPPRPSRCVGQHNNS